MHQCTLNKTINLVLYLIYFKSEFYVADNNICSIKDESGNVRKVCCADFEEQNSVCEPCLSGYTSESGRHCRPCPTNTFGESCIWICNCNEFQRCDNRRGCVNINTKEASTEVNQATISIKKDFTTITGFNDGPDFTTITGFNEGPGLSSREIIMVYSLSASVLILIVCLCVVIIKYKREQQRRVMQNSNPEQVSNIIENNAQEGIEDTHSYEDIDVNDLNVEPELIVNDFLEVVAESDNSNSSNGQENERNGYLNPYQPFVLQDEMKYSYEKLQFQPMVAICSSDKSNADVIDITLCDTANQSTMVTSYENKHYYIEIAAKLDKYVHEIQQGDTGYGKDNSGKSIIMKTAPTFEKILRSNSSCDLRKVFVANTSTFKKYHTY